ncbi:MAG: hypothetical protein K6C41_06815 [Lachnospiraceae bacterium]|nr:hypothetical protein [Lachnospiraceae bacterium]
MCSSQRKRNELAPRKLLGEPTKEHFRLNGGGSEVDRRGGEAKSFGSAEKGKVEPPGT